MLSIPVRSRLFSINPVVAVIKVTTAHEYQFGPYGVGSKFVDGCEPFVMTTMGDVLGLFERVLLSIGLPESLIASWQKTHRGTFAAFRRHHPSSALIFTVVRQNGSLQHVVWSQGSEAWSLFDSYAYDQWDYGAYPLSSDLVWLDIERRTPPGLRAASFNGYKLWSRV